jgi:hypothetical protein
MVAQNPSGAHENGAALAERGRLKTPAFRVSTRWTYAVGDRVYSAYRRAPGSVA